MLELAALEGAIQIILDQPEVQADISLAEKWILEAVETWATQEADTIVQCLPQEVETITSLIGRLSRLIIKKFKELFNMKFNLQMFTDSESGAKPAVSVQPVSWSATSAQAELDVLSAGIQAMAAHESWPTVRDSLIPNLVALLVNYGASLITSKLSK